MITAGGVPRVIDYQGARMAPPAYDVASMLWDPYHRLDDGLREELLEYYVKSMERDRAKEFNRKEFMNSLIPCRLQRHMQALGAYGFLSVVKGKRYFLKHVPEAMRMLKEEAVAAKSEYPALHKLSKSLV
jgi:aminoglycoside/choline kinase family phosphotransferase